MRLNVEDSHQAFEEPLHSVHETSIAQFYTKYSLGLVGNVCGPECQ